MRPKGDLVGLLGRYLRQETLDPLRSLGRYLLFGAAGSVLIGAGAVFLAVGGLRVLQATGAFAGSWSFVPYLLVALALAGLVAFAATRIGGGRGLDA